MPRVLITVSTVFFFLGLFGLQAKSHGAEASPPPPLLVEVRDGGFFIRGEDVSLQRLLEAVKRELDVEVLGLESRSGETFTLDLAHQDMETLLRRLMRTLGEDNYAFEYTGDRLFRVTVFPSRPGSTLPARAAPSHGLSSGNVPRGTARAGVVRVRGIIENSQAERLGLKQGDLILAYDGVRVTHAQALVTQVRKKSGQAMVSMVILREGERMDLDLEAGFIGVRIESARVPKEILPPAFQ